MTTPIKKAGRPKKPNRVNMTITIDKDVADQLRTYPDKLSTTIEKALRDYFEKEQRITEQP